MLGLNSTTGKAIDGVEHVMQSIRDIITTPRGSRVMLREYGCAAPDLVDRPINELFELEMHASIAEALAKWEPRFTLRSSWMSGRDETGRVTIGIEGTINASNATIRLEGIKL